MKAPPSKSMAHRLLICAGFADGESLIYGVDPSEDVLATTDCLKALGAELRMADGDVTVRG
jgi:3-phosphoshikimate 1-carboxyvinyltransferase